MFTSGLFLPVSLERFLVSISSSFSRASLFPFCLSRTCGQRPGFPKNQARGRLLFSLLAGDRDQVLCAHGGRESLCVQHDVVATPPQAVRTPGCPFSPSFTPHFPNGLHAAASLGKGHSRATDNREGGAWAGRPPAHEHSSSVAGGSWASAAADACWASVEPVYTNQFCYWLWDPEGLLSCAVHLDNLRSQGQHSERGLKHLEKLSLWQAHITPHLLVHHCLF